MNNNPVGWFEIYVQDMGRAKAARSGGKVEKGKFSIGQYGNISLVIDTGGNMIGLHSIQ